MATYEPTIQVEAAFGFGALDDSPDWTTIGVVQSGSIRRGRSKEFDRFPSGACSLQLVDHDRTFDPLNSAGSYAGSLLPNVPIRIVASHGGTDYPRFYGYADSWQVSSRHNVGLVSLSATDGTKLIARKTLRSAYEATCVADSPRLYARLAETGSIAPDVSGNRNNGYFENTAYVGQQAASIVPFSNHGSVEMKGEQTTAVRFDASVRQTDTTGAFEVWVETSEDLSVLGDMPLWIFTQSDLSTSVDRRGVYYNPADATHGGGGPTLAVIVRTPTVYIVWYYVVPRLDDGQAHWIGFNSGDTTQVTMLDGLELGPATFNSTSVGFHMPGVYIGVPPGSGRASWRGRVAALSIYDTALDVDTLRAHYLASRSPWDGDNPGTRIGRVLDQIGWPAGLRALDDGETLLGPADIGGVNAWEYLNLIAQTEGGRAFFENDGALAFHGAARLRANTSAAAVFSDDGSDVPYAYGSGAYTFDERHIYNQASVQRKYGTPQTAEDVDSVGTYGPNERTLTGLLMRTDREAQNRAEQLVYRYKDPQVRLDAIQVEPEVKPSTWPDNLGLEIGAHIAFEIQTAGTLARETLELDLEQIAESFTPSRYQLTYVGSPRDPNIENYFTIGGTLLSQSIGHGVFA